MELADSSLHIVPQPYNTKGKVHSVPAELHSILVSSNCCDYAAASQSKATVSRRPCGPLGDILVRPGLRHNFHFQSLLAGDRDRPSHRALLDLVPMMTVVRWMDGDGSNCICHISCTVLLCCYATDCI